MLGSSHIKHFHEKHATSDPAMRYFGKSGLKLGTFSKLAREAQNIYPYPAAVVVHVGGNDIMEKPLHEMRLKANEILLETKLLFPYSYVFYSEAFCRTKYRSEDVIGAAERSRISFNTRVKAMCNRENIGIISHQNLTYSHLRDGVHLSLNGEELFILNIKSAVRKLNDQKYKV